jgi:hypothetical protein
MTTYDQVSANESLDQEVDRLRARSADIGWRERYQKRPLTTDKMRQSTQAQARYGLRAYVIKICCRAARPALMRTAALIITWFVLLAMTAVGAIWADALRQIGAVP